MTMLMNFLLSLVKDEEGQGMVEYGLILALVAVVVIVVLTTMGEQVGEIFQQVVDALGGGGE